MSEFMNADTEARRRIHDDIETNFFVEAGAGSGKTTALVDRMVAMVEGGIDVEKICAITFTVAASREFFDRFQDELNKRRELPDVSPIVKERIQNAIRHIDLCFMGTIDSFCNQILGVHPIQAGVPSTVTLTEDAEVIRLYRREYVKLKHGKYGRELLELYWKFCTVHQYPDEAYLSCISQYMGAHASRWVMPEMPEEDWRVAGAEQLDQLLSVLEIIDGRKENLSEKNAGFRTAKQTLPDAIRALRNYRNENAFPEVLSTLKKITAPDDESKLGGLGLICEPRDIGIVAETLFSMRGKKPVIYCLALSRRGGLINRLLEYQYAVTVRFLSAFAVKMAEVLKENGELSFYDYLLNVRNMLRDDAAAGGQLVQHIRSHYSYFLIDEFQDTDPLQAEVFFRLAAESPTEDWRDARLVPGSLFIVGDPKQSIYRFRGADVSSYLAVKQLFVPPVGEVLSLQRNFRSCDVLRRWYNDTFTALLPDETWYQSRFELIPTEEESEEEGLLSGAWHYRTGKNTNAGDVAEIIYRLVNNPDILIHTRKDRKNGNPPRMIRYRDIMVITRTKTPLAECLLAMKNIGIPCRVDGRTAFSECPAFVTLADLMAIFANPSDSLAVYRVLRGYLFRFSQEEITEWVLRDNKLTLYGHEEDEDDVSAALTALNEFRKQSTMLSPAALCQAMLEEFRLFLHCGTENMEYVWFAIELLRNGVDQKGSKSLTDAAAFLNNLAEGRTDTDKILDLNGESNRVYLANLHKVKGLEAPIVILAQTEYKKRAPEVHMEMDGAVQKRWALKLTGPGYDSPTYAVTEQYEDEMNREAISLDAEETRLMYVAATRAGCALLIPETGKDCLWDLLLSAETKDLAMIMPPLNPEETETVRFGFEQRPDEWNEMLEENPLLHTEAETETWQLNLPSELHDNESEPAVDCDPEPNAAFPRGETSSLLLGTVIHRAMEMLVSSKASLSDETIVDTIRDEYDLEDDAENDDVSEYVSAALKKIRGGGWEQESGIKADILSELLSADEVYCEVPFCVFCGDTLTNGVMDVVYRKDGAWNVIDYKTNADPCGLDQIYFDQLTAYRNATRQLFGVVASVHTYHIPLLK